MKKFAISWISLFDNTLEMELVDSISEYEALKLATLKSVGTFPETIIDCESLKEFAFDYDCMIAAIEVE